MTRSLPQPRRVVAVRHVAPALRVLAIALLTACGGGGDSGGTTDPPPATPTIALSASSSSGSVQAAGELSTTISLTRGGGYTGTVLLAAQGLPAGVSASFAAGTLTGATTSSGLTLSVAATAAPGSYPLSVVASGAGVTSASVAYQLTVTAAPVPTLSLSIAPDTLTVAVVATDTASISLTRSGGLSSPISFFYSATSGSLFGDITLDFSPDTATGTAASETVRLAVTIGNSIAPGVYPYTITGRTAGVQDQSASLVVKVVAPPSAGTLRLSTEQIQVVQGTASTPVGIVLERAPGVTGPITWSIDNLPALVDATFTPNPSAGDSTTLVITPEFNSPPGGVQLRIRASAGGSSVVDTLTVITQSFVPVDFGIAPSVQTLVVTAGTSLDMDVAVSRTGGFAGAVSVTLSGAPASITTSLAPDPITGDRGTLTVTASPTAADAIYPVTLTATGVGLSGTRTATFSIAVVAPSGGSITWQFCGPARIPTWFAIRSGGIQGAWTRVMPTSGNSFTFSFPSSGQVAYVQAGANGSALQIYQYRPAEMYQQAALECAEHPVQKAVTGTIANVNLIQGMHVAVGGADTSVLQAPTSFALPGVADRTTDLLAVRGSYSATDGYDFILRAILRRNINPAPGAALPLIDFDGPEWIAFGGGNGSLLGTQGDSLRTEMALLTSNGLVGTYYRDRFGLGTTRIHWGLVPSALAASDLHRLTAITEHATLPRRMVRYRRSAFGFFESTFGPRLDGVNVLVLGTSPAVTARSVGQWSDAYGYDVSTTYRQGVGATARAVTLTSARSYYGIASTGYNMILPDFTGVDGFNVMWMLQAGTPVSWEHWVSGLENGVADAPLDGLIKRSGGMRGTFTP